MGLILILSKINRNVNLWDRGHPNTGNPCQFPTHIQGKPKGGFMSVIKKHPTQKRLKELFNYRKNGQLIRKSKTSNRVKVGDVAGGINKTTGYCDICVDNENYRAHRLIFIWHHGYNPENDIDHHPDRNRTNNRIENLREATRSCNLRNTGNPCTNKSGVKGVWWCKSRNKWAAEIMVMQKKKYLGYHKDFNEAVLYRFAAEQCLNWEGCDSSSPAYLYLKERGIL